MGKVALPTTLPENRLLSRLPRADLDRLLSRMDEVDFDFGDVAYRPNGAIKHIYFPRIGVLSDVVVLKDGDTVEVGTIGKEGMAGLPVFHGAEFNPRRVYCEVPPCRCRRMTVAVFREEIARCGPFAERVALFAEALMGFSAQSIACIRLHPLEERLARWLLMTHDRMGMDEYQLTQQVLSEMLGVRRATVTVAAGMLQQAGLIRYRRGLVTILDRKRLEEASCECYATVQDDFTRLLGKV